MVLLGKEEEPVTKASSGKISLFFIRYKIFDFRRAFLSLFLEAL